MSGKQVCHLHVHTEYSMLDGAARVRELVAQAVQLGMPALAVTDHGALYGLIDFYTACHEAGIKPILGCELYLARGSRFSKDKADDSPKTIQHITVLAKDVTGYRNLLKLATAASLEGTYYKPRVDMDLLAEHSEGLIGTTGCLNGQVPRLIAEGRLQDAREAAGRWQDIFGRDSFFIELQDHGIADQHKVNPHLIELSDALQIPLVATNDLHYTSQADAEAHDVLLCIQTGATVDEPDRFRFDGNEFFLKSREEMEAALPHHHHAIDRTLDVAEMCNVTLTFGELQLPDFITPDGSSLDDHLRKLVVQGAKRRYGDLLPDEVVQRIDYELSVISRMGFAGYFLVVADLVGWAKGKGIRVGPGRGSAAGTITCYSLGITTLDPIRYGLVFERFLNPERREMPDFDIDFDERYRGEVITYLRQKYGEDRVAQIVTFATIKAKSGIRDSARVLGYPYGMGDRLAKMFPRSLLGKDPSLKDCFEKSKDSKWTYAYTEAAELRKAHKEETDARRVLDAALKLEGLRRQTGVHAAAVVVGREPLVNHTALQRTDQGDVVTQYEMHAIEALGLLKFDFLGLSNLTILKNAVDLIRAHRGIDIDLDNIPLDDAKTFELLSTGETTGIFQLESAGMRRYVRELRPSSVFDLAAMVALYRPGPMDNIPAYIRRKHGQEAVTYLHPLLEPFLERTYGIFVYQEDIMAAAIALGGFTGPEADTLGYAIRKKKSSVLRAQKEKFVTQAAERGVPPQTIDAVFKAFEPFERYGFNKAHATCYGLIAYQTAYLKANYTVDYMAAVLSAFRDNEEKVAAAIAECRRIGIEVRPPDVGKSSIEFTVEDEGIRFGLLAVKNVGQGAIESIIAARQAEGPFKSLGDLCRRIDLRLANRKVLESLAKVGALASFGHPAQILEGLDDAIAAGAATQRDLATGQTSLFDVGATDALVLERPLPTVSEATVRERLRWEKELLGLYLSEHPMGEVAEQVGEYVTAYSGDLRSDESLDGQRVVVGGIVVAARTVVTRTRSVMSVVTLEDLQGAVEVVVFPRLYEQTGPIWQDGAILLVAGRVDHRGEEVSLLADVVVPWDEAVAKGPEAFAREVAAGDRGGGRRRQPVPVGPGGAPQFAPTAGQPGPRPYPNGNGNAASNGYATNGSRHSNANGNGNGSVVDLRGLGLGRRPDVEYVSPLRGGVMPEGGPLERPGSRTATLPAIAPAAPVTTDDAVAGSPLADRDVEPALPEELRARAAAEAGAATSPIEAAPAGSTLHVRFGGVPAARLVLAMESFRQIARERPGGTRVVVYVPGQGGTALPMELRSGVAYDAELLAEVRRRLGEGIVEMQVTPPGA